MPNIQAISLHNLGYRQLAASDFVDPDVRARFAELARTYVGYDVMSQGSDPWIRSAGRRAGKIPECLRLRATLDHTTPPDECWTRLEFLSEPLSVGSQDAEDKYEVTKDDCIAMCTNAATSSSEPAWRSLHFLTAATALCPRSVLRFIVAKHVLPAYLSLFPSSRLMVFSSDYDYERRFGFCRALHRHSQFPIADLASSDSSALENLHSVSLISLPLLLAALLGALSYPWVTVVPAIRLGYFFLFVLDPPPENAPGFFPVSWTDKLRTHANFAAQPIELRELLRGSDPKVQFGARHRRLALASPPSIEETVGLVEFAIDRFNRALWHFSDPAEHCPPGLNAIAPLAPFEFILTTDRLLRKGILSTFGADEIDRKDDCFECADLIEELVRQRNAGPPGANVFKELFSRTGGIEIAKACLADAPPRVAAPLLQNLERSYDLLVAGIDASIAIKSKRTPQGVLVRNRTLKIESVESLEDFVANVMRALRNAHHGYLSSNDGQVRPARYLSLVDGSIPDAVNYLGTFWAFCSIVVPELLLKRSWIQVGGYEA